jgi:hypothetical protein
MTGAGSLASALFVGLAAVAPSASGLQYTLIAVAVVFTLIAIVGTGLIFRKDSGASAKQTIAHSPRARQSNVGIGGDLNIIDVYIPASIKAKPADWEWLLALAERINRFVDNHHSTGRCSNRVFQGAFASDFRNVFAEDVRRAQRLITDTLPLERSVEPNLPKTDEEAYAYARDLEKFGRLLRAREV